MQYDEVKKAMIQVVQCHFEVIFCNLINGNCDFFQVVEATIQVAEWHLKVNYCILSRPKFDFREFEKAMFLVVARQSELIFFLLTNRNCD